VLEEAIAERIKAIAALQKAIEEEPRGFHVAPGARLRGDERRNKTYVPRFVALYKQAEIGEMRMARKEQVYDDIPGTFVFDAERSRRATASTCSACR
jgi:hypothetical protein